VNVNTTRPAFPSNAATGLHEPEVAAANSVRPPAVAGLVGRPVAAFARPVWSRVKVTWPTQCGNSGGVSVLIAVCFTFCDKKVDQIRGSRKGTTAT
jgi:hypothetical protein